MDGNACNITTRQWSNASWRSDQVGAMQNHNWENSSCSVFFRNTTCNQGSVPILAVDAILPEHVQATVRFASKHNLRLVIKTTGHDYLGRSTARGSLLLWLHHVKNMTMIDRFTSCGSSIANAVRFSAGVQWGEAYEWLDRFNLTAVGGASATVGTTGGYTQGGGHSPLSRWKGLAADNVLEFDIVTADGRRLTVNSCEDEDLFWALRGGGGGTFGVVLNVVLRTFPSSFIIGTAFTLSLSNDTNYEQLIRDFVHFLPTLADGNWSGYFSFFDSSIAILMLVPNGDISVANSTLYEFVQNKPELTINDSAVYPFPSFYWFFYYTLAPANPTGFNVLLGSRLIPESIVRNQPDDVAQAFINIRRERKYEASLLGHLVAGGEVSKLDTNYDGVNPVWRTSLIHMVYAVGWSDLASKQEQDKIAEHLRSQVDILQTVAGGSQSGCYKNEADPNEPDWQQKFFGTQATYDRLKSIKQLMDPHELFICENQGGNIVILYF